MTNTAASAAAGAQIAALFGLSDYQSMRSSSLKSEQITVTRLRSTTGSGMTETIPQEKASVVSFQLDPLEHHELWKGGTLFYSGGFARNTTSVVHLEESPQAFLPGAYDCLQFHIPDLVLRELADQEDFPTFSELGGRDARVDPIAASLSRSLLPALENPAEAGRLFFDHVGIAYCMHLLKNYCGDIRPSQKSGSLSKEQLGRAKELLSAHIGEDPPLAAIAQACGLPISVFSRAFKRSSGASPHEWLRARRIEIAQGLLARSSDSLAEIAYACGFADQSHMNRLFVSLTGETPGQYRKRTRFRPQND